MPENYYGIVEMLFSFGLLIAFCVWQLWSVEKTRKRLRGGQEHKDERD
jgi:hypothetical protein